VVRQTFQVLLFLLAISIPVRAGDVDGEVRTGPRSGLNQPASVQLVKNGEIVAERLTDLNGRFEFLGLPAGDYTLRIKYPGFQDTEVPLRLGDPSMRSRVPITLTPVTTDADTYPSVLSVDELRVPRNARNAFEDGARDRKRGNCAKAVQHLQKAVSLYANYGDAFNELGICYKEMGRTAEAEDAFKKANQYSSSVYPAINLADLYAGQRRFEEAERVVRSSFSRYPTEGDLFFALARIFFEQGRMKEAEAAGLEAHSRVHRAADVHLLMAKIYLAANNYPALATQLEAYLEENPEGPVAEQARITLRQLRTPSPR
jgi:hypothetical protein